VLRWRLRRKHERALLACSRRVERPRLPLTTREREVLNVWCRTPRPRAVATRLGISASTVRTHLQHLRQKGHLPST
jgi:DNA-binding CsgD family transcriptional regulator